MPDEFTYTSIRDHYVMGQFIGKRIIDITESDPDEPSKFIMLMFEDGSAIGIDVPPQGFTLINVDSPEDDAPHA